VKQKHFEVDRTKSFIRAILTGSGSVGDIIEAISCQRPRFHQNGYFLLRNCDFSTIEKAYFLGVLLGD
jgi:hypothetical protein